MALVLTVNFEFAGFQNKKYMACDHFYGNGLYGKSPVTNGKWETL